jgi:hypothetical protein
MTAFTIFSILVVHYIFDFVLQSRWMAENKSKNLSALTQHVLIYTAGLLGLAVVSPALSVWWALGNGAIHWLVDFTTSRISSKAYQSNNLKSFWNTIGADQLIHSLCLLLSV